MMLYASGAAAGTETLTWFDRSGKTVGTVGDPGGFYDVDLSPDEKKLAVTNANTSNATIWIHDLESKLQTRLTFSGGTHRTPVWSPDGHEIAFTANQQSAIVVKTIGGSAPERTLVSSATPLYQGITDWSRDGRYLMVEQGPGVNVQLWVVPMFGDQKPFPYTKSSAQERDGSFSPDGRWVAYMSNETGRPEIFVAPFPWTGAKWQVSNGGGADARWRADGKELYYFDFTGIAAAEVDGKGSEFKVGGTKPLFRLSVKSLSREYAPTHDGQRFIAIAASEGASQSLTLVQNWTAELKRK
jgi:Tol biopolymer transport system component